MKDCQLVSRKIGDTRMLITIYDGIKSFVVPDCAMCIIEGDRINNMDKCPLWKCESEYDCDPDCEFYTEDWD